jgi:uncharacterized protein YjdB
MKPKFNYNQNKVKNSSNKYRNIDGIYYEHWTSDESVFKEESKIAILNNLKYKIINNEFYREVK